MRTLPTQQRLPFILRRQLPFRLFLVFFAVFIRHSVETLKVSRKQGIQPQSAKISTLPLSQPLSDNFNNEKPPLSPLNAPDTIIRTKPSIDTTKLQNVFRVLDQDVGLAKQSRMEDKKEFEDEVRKLDGIISWRQRLTLGTNGILAAQMKARFGRFDYNHFLYNVESRERMSIFEKNIGAISARYEGLKVRCREEFELLEAEHKEGLSDMVLELQWMYFGCRNKDAWGRTTAYDLRKWRIASQDPRATRRTGSNSRLQKCLLELKKEVLGPR